MNTSKGVWISHELIQNKKLSWTKKIILQEISQLIASENKCVANNRHFATLIGIGRTAVSNAISELEKEGYIIIDNTNTFGNNGRKIIIHENAHPLIQQNVTDVQQNVTDVQQNKSPNGSNTKPLDNKELFVEIFSKNKIKTHLQKVNLSMCDKKILNEIGVEKVAEEYAEYVIKNKQLASRLNIWLIAYSENALGEIQHGVQKRTSKAEVGSIQWEIDKMGGLDSTDYIEVFPDEN